MTVKDIAGLAAITGDDRPIMMSNPAVNRNVVAIEDSDVICPSKGLCFKKTEVRL